LRRGDPPRRQLAQLAVLPQMLEHRVTPQLRSLARLLVLLWCKVEAAPTTQPTPLPRLHAMLVDLPMPRRAHRSSLSKTPTPGIVASTTVPLQGV